MSVERFTISLTFLAYLGGMLVIGYLAFRRTRDLADYILGGRKLGPWVTALSAGASDMSGWLLLGLPGYAYASGFEAAWIVVGLWSGTYINWRLVAGRLRRYSELANNALTLPEFFEHRFGDRSHLLRALSACFILLFFLFYTSAGLVAGGKLFETVFGLPYTAAVASGAAAIVLYTFLGGFLAVSWTDLIQGLLMALALTVAPLFGLALLGGWKPTIAAMEGVNPALLNPWAAQDGTALGMLAIVSLLGWGLGYFGQPHILARFMAIRSATHIPAARRIAMAWVSIGMLGALLAGFTGVGLLDPPLQGADSEKVFIQLVGTLLHPIPAGICLAAILAAIMSTADSQLLVASSALTEDFYQALLRRNAGRAELVWVGRLAVIVIALLAFGLALDRDSKVLDLVAYAWAGFGAAFGPALLGALYWERMTRHGALAGILTGGLTVVLWKQWSGGILDLYEIVPGFLLSSTAVFVVSLLGRSPDAELVRQFRAATALDTRP